MMDMKKCTWFIMWCLYCCYSYPYFCFLCCWA